MVEERRPRRLANAALVGGLGVALAANAVGRHFERKAHVKEVAALREELRKAKPGPKSAEINEDDFLSLADHATQIRDRLARGGNLSETDLVKAGFTLANLYSMHTRDKHPELGPASPAWHFVGLRRALDEKGYLDSLRKHLPPQTRKRLGIDFKLR